MHNDSLPPSDRNERPAADPALLAEIRAKLKHISQADLGRAIGYSSAAINTYASGKYGGDLTSIEPRLREWLFKEKMEVASGVTIIDTEVSRLICQQLEEAAHTGQLVVITAPAGWGKSCGASLYLTKHPLAFAFRVTRMHSGIASLADDICSAADITWPPVRRRRKAGTAPAPRQPRRSRWDTIIAETTGTERLLIVDDAHELGQCSLQCCVDFWEKTGNPVALLGLEHLKKRLLADDRRSSRVKNVFNLAAEVTNHKPLVEHQIDELAPDANGERDELLTLCLQVAAHPGAYRSVENQLQLAAKIRRKKNYTWVEAFRTAHKRLLRSYSLS